MYKIKNIVGDHLFKLERIVRGTKKTKEATDLHGGEISWELRTAVYLIMITGASYLDIIMIYDVCQKHV